MRQGGRRQYQDLQVLHARQVLQCQLPAESLAEKYKKDCKRRACAELHDEALFKDPPAKEDCPICFLLMPARLICCATSFQDATITSVPIFDFAKANEGLAKKAMEEYYLCCGKSICRGCVHSFKNSGNDDKCPFCNSDRVSEADTKEIEELMKRVEANDAGCWSNFCTG